MKTLRKILALTLVALMALTCLTACGGKGGEEAAKEIRYLNFKPEIAEIYQEIAEKYEAETGVKVIVETAANNTYEQTLMSKMATDEAPTLFQINGPRGYANWADYCADLSDTELYKHLTDKGLAVEVDGKAYGIPYVVEGYGIIYNQAI
ncbi:MAG: extracellular solute-binding protein, partial [Clostridia bacterium]|nr:extracellular solute-binding protein [Clostridia bacterium]